MSKRSRPKTVSTRVTLTEDALIEAISAEEGVTKCEAIHRLLMPAVHRRVARLGHTQTPIGPASDKRPAAFLSDS